MLDDYSVLYKWVHGIRRRTKLSLCKMFIICFLLIVHNLLVLYPIYPVSPVSIPPLQFPHCQSQRPVYTRKWFHLILIVSITVLTVKYSLCQIYYGLFIVHITGINRLEDITFKLSKCNIAHVHHILEVLLPYW